MVDFILSAVQSVLCSWWNVSSSFSFLSVMTFPVVLLLIHWSVVFVQLLILCVFACVFFQAFWFLNCLFCFLKSRALAQGFMVMSACIYTYFSRILILITEEKCEGSTQWTKWKWYEQAANCAVKDRLMMFTCIESKKIPALAVKLKRSHMHIHTGTHTHASDCNHAFETVLKASFSALKDWGGGGGLSWHTWRFVFKVDYRACKSILVNGTL